MFALLISLPGWGQSGREPGDPPSLECEEPLNVIHYTHNITSLNSLPCMGPADPETGTSARTQTFAIAINNGNSFGYQITSTKSIEVVQLPNPPGEFHVLGAYVFDLRFLEPGWHTISIKSINNNTCEEEAIFDIPVLCDCPSFSYTVTGNPNTTTVIEASDIDDLSNKNHFVIGDLEIRATQTANAQSPTFNITGSSFNVLGRVQYNPSSPGGTIFGPKISITRIDPQTGNSNSSKGLTLESSNFNGLDCFGMWKGIEISDSLASQPPFILFRNISIKDGLVGVNILTGSRFALKLESSKIDACLYGIIAKRDGLGQALGLSINSLNKPLLKPFDYGLNSTGRNESFDNGNTINRFYTTIGFWQATDRVSTSLNLPFTNISNCLVGFKYGDGNKLSTMNPNLIENVKIANCHLTNLWLNVPDNIAVRTCEFTLKNLFEGNKVTTQILGLVPSFVGPELIGNLSVPSLTFSNHYGIYMQNGLTLNLMNSDFIDKTLTNQVSYIDRPIGLYCSHLGSMERVKMIFNDNHNNSPLGEGDIATAEVRATACIIDATGNSPQTSKTTEIRDSWFRNVKSAFVFKNTTFSILSIGCNYFQNVYTGFDLTASSSFSNDLGTTTVPCGNRFTWNDTYYGLPNVAPNDCKVVVGNNTSPTYFGFANEEIIIGLGNLTPNFNNGTGIQKGLPGAACPNAVRDPIPPKVKPVTKPFEIDPNHFGIYNLLGRKVAEINSHEGSLPNGFYLKLDENGKTIFSK